MQASMGDPVSAVKRRKVSFNPTADCLLFARGQGVDTLPSDGGASLALDGLMQKSSEPIKLSHEEDLVHPGKRYPARVPKDRLNPIPRAERDKMLQQSGVSLSDEISCESNEIQKRYNEQKKFCDCKDGMCIPGVCECSSEGISCHAESNYGCKCKKHCKNPEGIHLLDVYRINKLRKQVLMEFNPPLPSPMRRSQARSAAGSASVQSTPSKDLSRELAAASAFMDGFSTSALASLAAGKASKPQGEDDKASVSDVGTIPATAHTKAPKASARRKSSMLLSISSGDDSCLEPSQPPPTPTAIPPSNAPAAPPIDKAKPVASTMPAGQSTAGSGAHSQKPIAPSAVPSSVPSSVPSAVPLPVTMPSVFAAVPSVSSLVASAMSILPNVLRQAAPAPPLSTAAPPSQPPRPAPTSTPVPAHAAPAAASCVAPTPAPADVVVSTTVPATCVVVAPAPATSNLPVSAAPASAPAPVFAVPAPRDVGAPAVAASERSEPQSGVETAMEGTLCVPRACDLDDLDDMITSQEVFPSQQLTAGVEDEVFMDAQPAGPPLERQAAAEARDQSHEAMLSQEPMSQDVQMDSDPPATPKPRTRAGTSTPKQTPKQTPRGAAKDATPRVTARSASVPVLTPRTMTRAVAAALAAATASIPMPPLTGAGPVGNRVVRPVKPGQPRKMVRSRSATIVPPDAGHVASTSSLPP